jgi:hypothetical protein
MLESVPVCQLFFERKLLFIVVVCSLLSGEIEKAQRMNRRVREVGSRKLTPLNNNNNNTQHPYREVVTRSSFLPLYTEFKQII